MSNRNLETPVGLNGLPLPIIPGGLLDRRHNFGEQYETEKKNYHHHFHPERSQVLLNSLGGKAVRVVRGQVIEKYLHDRYHKIFQGPEIIDDDDQFFRLVVMSIAGSVPPQAIDLSKPGEVNIVELTRKDKRYIRQRLFAEGGQSQSKNHLSTFKESKSTIEEFLSTYAAKKCTDIIDEVLFEEFLDVDTPLRRKRRIGNYILGHTLNEDLRNLERETPKLRQEGYSTLPIASSVYNYFGLNFTIDALTKHLTNHFDLATE